MGINKNRVFDREQIQLLINKTQNLMDAADSIINEIHAELCRLSDTLSRIPADLRDGGLWQQVEHLKGSIKTNEFQNYRAAMTKSLDRLKETIPREDKKLGAKLLVTADAVSAMTDRLKNLKELIPEGADSGSYEDFEKAFGECTRGWNAVNGLLQHLMEQIAASLKGGSNESVCLSKDPVNLSTGNFIYEKTDLKLAGVPELAMTRFYNELDKQEGSMGRGWYHPYEVRLLIQEDSYTVLLEDGKEEHFRKKKDGSFFGETTTSRLMTEAVTGKNGEAYCYRTRQGECYCFNKEGKYNAWEDRAGNRLRLTYEGGCLKQVLRENDGAFLAFHYDEQGRLIQVSDQTGRSAFYAYDENGCLCSAKNPEGAEYRYTYDENGRIRSVINPVGTTTVQNTYDSQGRTVLQKFPDGGSMSYEYKDEEKQVVLTERNESRITYCHDERYRNVRTIYEDGEEQFTYNRKGQRIRYRDCNGNTTRYAYDSRGNLTQVIDALGVKSNATYNGNNQLLKLTVNGTEQLKNIYDSQGKLIKSRDALGRSTVFTYQEKGRLASITRPDGGSVSLTYDEKGNITGITDPYGNRSRYEYDACNRIILATDPKGGRTSYAYDGMNRITAVTNPLGQKTEYQYNENGKQTEVHRADGGVVKTEYNNLGRPSAIINADENRAEFIYDSMWNLSGVCLPNGAEEHYTYNSRNRLSGVTDALGNRTEYEYDANGNRVLVRDPDGEETRYTYNARNQITAVIDRAGNTTAYTYDERGFLIKVTDALGNERTMTYDEAGQKTSETDALGNITYYTYTPLGKIESVTDAKNRTMRYEYELGGRLAAICHTDGRKEQFTYDENGNIKTHTDAAGYTRTYAYDALDRILRIAGSSGEETRYTYDVLGNVSSVTDALGNVTSYEYSLTGLLTKVTDTLGNVTAYEYDALGNLTKICQHGEGDHGEEHVTQYERNRKGQVEKVMDALGQTETYTYNANGQLVEKKDKQGFLTTYGYTALGDVAHIRYADGREAELSYNPLRQLTEVKDWLGVTGIENDVMGRTTKVIHPNGKEISYTYGEAGERTSLTYPDGTCVHYSYDENLRLSELKEGDTVITYGYDENGKLTKKNFPNGMHTSYRYDEVGRIRELIHTDKEGVMDRYCYTYDLLGNKTRIEKQRRGLAEESGSWTYAYDALGRISEVRKDGNLHTAYGYDAFGNRIHESGRKGESLSTYNALNQLISRKDMLEGEGKETEYRYDPRGNLTEILENGIRKHAYVYGALNRLEEAENGNGQIARYDYNGLGFRVGKEIQNSNQEPFQKIRYTLDLTHSYHNLLEREEENRIQTWLWDGNAAGMWEEERNAGSIAEAESRAEAGTQRNYHFYLPDELGSPIRMGDAEGNLTETYGYGVFGEDLYQNQGEVQPFGYTGYQYDGVAGTYFAQAREYLPEVGRFVAKDAEQFTRMRKPISVNQYLYCGVNPLKYVDRSGYDHYIFYLPEWENEALSDQKQLADYYGIDNSKIHLIEITNDEELTEGWNAMGTENGKSVSIETVIINTHANPEGLGYGSGRTAFFDDEDIQALDNKNIDRLFLYGCNAGHLDYQGTNPASQFSQKVNGAPVLASDGTVYSHEKQKWMTFPLIWINDYMQYESRGNKVFNKLVEDAGSAERKNEGWFVYTWEEGRLNISESYGKRLDVKGMISATSEGKDSILKEMIIIMMMKEKQTCEINA